MEEFKTLAGHPVCPLGLAGNPDMGSACVDVAYQAGVNYFFFYSLQFQGLIVGLNRLVKGNRESVVLATGTESRDPAEMRGYFDQAGRRLGVEDIDIFFAEYISPSDDMAQVFGALEEIWAWKETGKVRYVGATCHNRELALKLIESGRVEVLMHRYNMAHRGAEEKVLPAAESADIPVVSFTNTRWGSLLKGHSDWQGDPPQAADCYRYVLRQQAVKLALTAPGTVRELKENLDVVIHSS